MSERGRGDMRSEGVAVPEQPKDVRNGLFQKLQKGPMGAWLRRLVVGAALASPMGASAEAPKHEQATAHADTVGSSELSPIAEAGKWVSDQLEDVKDAVKAERAKHDAAEPGSVEAMTEPSWTLTSAEWFFNNLDAVQKADWDVDARGTFLEKNQDGSVGFNPWSILSPVQVEVSASIEKPSHFGTEIPYIYNRAFGMSGEKVGPSNAEDEKKMEEFLKEEFRQEFLDIIIGFDVNKRVHALDNDVDSSLAARKLRVTDMKVKGLTSPEGHARHGSETIMPYSVDAENIALGMSRAGKGREAAVQALEGLDAHVNPELEVAPVSADELQFSGPEMAELAEMAKDQKGRDSVERVFNLIRGFNRGETSVEGADPAVDKRLQEVVAAKRKVEVEIDYEGNKKETVLIPLPLLLLALMAIPRIPWRGRERTIADGPLKRGKGENIHDEPVERGSGDVKVPRENTDVWEGGPETDWREIAGNVRKAWSIDTEVSPADAQVVGHEAVAQGDAHEIEARVREMERTMTRPEFEPVTLDAALPAEGSPEYQKMLKETLVDDLYVNFDRRETVERGIDYRDMVSVVDETYGAFRDAGEREAYLTARLLDDWRAHDLQCRREAGLSEAALTEGLDYRQDANQVRYAKMHAKELLRIVDTRRAITDKFARMQTDYDDVLLRRVIDVSERKR